MKKTEDDNFVWWCGIVWAVFIIAMMIIVVIFATKADRELKILKAECRDLWWYIETFYRGSNVICRNREWTSIYFRK